MRRWSSTVVGSRQEWWWPWREDNLDTRGSPPQPVDPLVLRELAQARPQATVPCSVYSHPYSGGPPLLGVARPQQTPQRRARRLRLWWPRGGGAAAVLSRAAAVWRRLDRRAPSMRARPPHTPHTPHTPRPARPAHSFCQPLAPPRAYTCRLTERRQAPPRLVRSPALSPALPPLPRRPPDQVAHRHAVRRRRRAQSARGAARVPLPLAHALALPLPAGRGATAGGRGASHGDRGARRDLDLALSTSACDA